MATLASLIPVTMTEGTAADFLSTLKFQVPRFIEAMEKALVERFEMDVSNLAADHVCWRTETKEEYSELVKALTDDCAFQLLVESEIGGRPIATFSLTDDDAISAGSRGAAISVIEIPAPKPGRAYGRGLEHVEFVLDDSRCTTPVNDERHQSAFDAFMRRYPNVPWDTRAKAKAINPDVSVKVELELFGSCSVKFHLLPLAKVIEYEKEAGMSNS